MPNCVKTNHLSHDLTVFIWVIHSRVYKKCEDMSGERMLDIKVVGTTEVLFSFKL